MLMWISRFSMYYFENSNITRSFIGVLRLSAILAVFRMAKVKREVGQKAPISRRLETREFVSELVS